MGKYIDLHVHSTASDGTLSPKELVEKAKEINLSAIALTDHDTIDGINLFMKSGRDYGINTIAGIELAGDYNDIEIHIVGIYIDYKNKDLNNFLKDIKQKREERNHLLINKLNSFGFNISYEDVKNMAGGDIITRAHYANVMVEKRYVDNKNEAFSKFLGDGKPCYLKRNLPSAEECIKIIKEAKGFAIIAHPTLYKMDYREIRKMCTNLIPLGLDGIEVIYSTYRHEQQREITRICDDLGLKPSGGSDFHGSIKPDIHLGVGKGNLRIPVTFLEKFID